MEFGFDAFVSAIIADGDRAAFVLGDGQVRWEDGEAMQAHEGAALCAAPHPSGRGVLTGGDDGRLVWSTPTEARVLLEVKGRWIDAVASAAGSGLIAAASGRAVTVLDAKEPAFRRAFDHPASVAGLAFEPKGRRLAAASYGGVALWYARIAEQKPVMLRWAGSHLALEFSPDGRFLVSAMQEPALHGWRVADAKDMAMSGYETRVKSLAFVSGGEWLATSGARGVVMWPFSGAGGPMGRQAFQIDLGWERPTVLVAANAKGDLLACAAEDGRVCVLRIDQDDPEPVRGIGAAPISALAVLSGGRVAWGDEIGAAGVTAPV
jgi:WD40 repeat protein